MPGQLVGSVWSVLGLEDAVVVILAGPFAADRGTPEYLVAPLYFGHEPGFVWTAEDVRLEAAEAGLGEPRFAAIWNARPLLEADLALQLGTLTEEATVAVRDAYWASLNERSLGANVRLGRLIKSATDPAAQFQARELERWEPLSGRVFASSAETCARAWYWSGDRWNLSVEDVEGLTRAMDETDGLLGSIQLDAVGSSRAVFTTTMSFWPARGSQHDLFAPTQGISQGWWSFCAFGVTVDAKKRKALEEVETYLELARAA